MLHLQERLISSKQVWSPVIVIDNTNVQKFEIYPYIQLANRYRYMYVYIPAQTEVPRRDSVLVL